MQETSGGEERERSRRLVHRKALDEQGPVRRTAGRRHALRARLPAGARRRPRLAPLRPRRRATTARRQLWLDERGTERRPRRPRRALRVREVARPLRGRRVRDESRSAPAAVRGRGSGSTQPRGLRPAEPAADPHRLERLLPAGGERALAARPRRRGLDDGRQRALGRPADRRRAPRELAFIKKKPKVAAKLAGIRRRRGPRRDRGRARAEARRSGRSSRSSSTRCSPRPRASATTCPSTRTSTRAACPTRTGAARRSSDGIAAVIQLHRLREVLALIGFTRFEAVTPDIDGEYETDVERAELALEPSWFPAVENRGEGIFLLLRRRRGEELARARRRQAAARRAARRAHERGRSDRKRRARRSRAARTCCCTRCRTC